MDTDSAVPGTAGLVSGRAGDRPGRVTAIVLDGLNTEFLDQSYARDQAIKAVERMQLNESVAFLALSPGLKLQNFTAAVPILVGGGARTTFQMTRAEQHPGYARSPFRIGELPTGREVGWINRFLDREYVCRLAEATLRSYAMDLLHFLRWWAHVNHSDAIHEGALSATSLSNFVRFQAGQHPQPTAATINHRVGVVERAVHNEFPDAGTALAPGFQHRRRSPADPPHAGCWIGRRGRS
jgi:hypothetical protein